MSTRLVRSIGFLVFAALGAHAAAQRRPTLQDVLARAAAYIERYEQELSGVVAEEQYVQDVTTDTAEGVRHRTLRSDILLIRPAGGDRYFQFRDVFEVDGEPVRDRNDRLERLFLQSSGGFDAGLAITRDSARYNIGRIDRTINVPLMALLFLDRKFQRQFRFAVSADPENKTRGLPNTATFSVSVDVWAVEYRETGDPTIVRDPYKHRNVPSRGRFWIEPESGRVLMTEHIAEVGDVRATVRVSYQSEPVDGLLVPIEMRETYTRSGRGRDQPYAIEGAATYSKFERLQAGPHGATRRPN